MTHLEGDQRGQSMNASRPISRSSLRRASRVGLVATLLLAATLSLSGCGFDIYKPGSDPLRGTLSDGAQGISPNDSGDDMIDPPASTPGAWASSDAWPARWPVWSGLSRAVVSTSNARPMGTIVRLPRAARPMSQARDTDRRVSEEQQQDVNMLMSRRRIRVGDATVRFEGEGPGSFVFVTSNESDEPITDDAAFYLKFVSGREVTPETSLGITLPGSAPTPPTSAITDDGDMPKRLVRIQRTWFAYYAPTVPDGQVSERATLARPRAIAVVLPGIFGTPESAINPLIQSLRDRGWGVLFMLAHPSRFTEQSRFEFNEHSDIDALGARIAATVTDRAAECAYAVHAAVLHVRQTLPQGATLPVSIIGMSGGAMVLSTVVARDPEMFQSAVVIAGGADFLGIAMDSTYTGWINAVRVVNTSETRAAETDARLLRAYYRAATLDSTRTFGVLRTIPTLMIHANADRAVPAKFGDLAWTLAGKPERWTIGLGHELLFFSLPWHTDRICDWVIERTPAPEKRPATPIAPPASPSAEAPRPRADSSTMSNAPALARSDNR